MLPELALLGRELDRSKGAGEMHDKDPRPRSRFILVRFLTRVAVDAYVARDDKDQTGQREGEL